MSIIDTTTGVAYGTLSAAIAASNANDVIQISPGTYVEDFPNITHSLTIESLTGLAFLSTTSPTPVNGRAVLNVPGDLNVNLTVSGLAISGAVDANNNGAGILFESGNGNLSITNSWFFNNQDGVLTGGVDGTDPGGMNISIQKSEFNNNGVAPSNPRYGFDHNLYVGGAATSLTVSGSYFHDAMGGDEIKSLALASTIINNRIQDGPTAAPSYSIDLSNGGSDIVSGNTIEKGPNALNESMVYFGSGSAFPSNSLLFSNNTLINDHGPVIAVLNQTQTSSGGPIPATIQNNIFYGFTTQGVNQDTFGPPYDNVSGSVFATGAPALNTADPFVFAAPCYAAGTGIETGQGRVAVERLRVGDLVRTAGGALVAVKWLGHRHVDCARHPRPREVWPVRVCKNAFGDGLPARDLRLSPDHAVFIYDVLIPIRALVNGATVIQESVDAIDYYHVELPSHDVILAEDLPAESYLDLGNRAAFDNGGGVMSMHADFSAGIWNENAYAELILGGPVLSAVRQRLLLQAELLGHVLVRQAAVHLLVDGDVVRAQSVNGAVHRFALPRPDFGELRVVSPASVPAAMSFDRDDWRRLGVRIAGVSAFRPWQWQQIALGALPEGEGFYAEEPGGGRWTDGNARLELPPALRQSGILLLDLLIDATQPSWQLAEARSRRRRGGAPTTPDLRRTRLDLFFAVAFKTRAIDFSGRFRSGCSRIPT